MFTADRDSYPQPQYEEIRIDHIEVLENLKNAAEKSIDSLMQQKRPRGNRLWDLDPWTKKAGMCFGYPRMLLIRQEESTISRCISRQAIGRMKNSHWNHISKPQTRDS